MTSVPRARMVLEDVKFVRENLESETGDTQWRLYWILAVVLLRTVGHVLDKVDGKEDSRVKRIANELYCSWQKDPTHSIFRDFIDRERNSILKEYATGMSEGPVPLAAVLRSDDGREVVEQFFIDENIYRPISAGTYEGEDGRTVLDDAIEWWESQLDEVDSKVQTNSVEKASHK